MRKWHLFKIRLGGSDSKASACNAGDSGLILESERSPGEGNGNPLQYSHLENPHGQKCLVGYSPWGHKESDTTEWPHPSTIRISSSAKKKKKLKRFKPEHLIGGTKGTQGKHYHVSDLSPQCFDFFSLYTHLPDHDLSSPITLLYWQYQELCLQVTSLNVSLQSRSTLPAQHLYHDV